MEFSIPLQQWRPLSHVRSDGECREELTHVNSKVNPAGYLLNAWKYQKSLSAVMTTQQKNTDLRREKNKILRWIQVDLFQSGLERSESCQNSPTDPRDREAFGRLREDGVFASPRRRLLAPAFLIWWFSCSWLRVPTDRYGETPEILWGADVRGGGL